ncbi:dual specificity protein kinase CLK1-like [Clupea harengus]|uniref:dual-specificity kinase n=1 Tax=Clupea harengus TaxID=7950 RepID=A0A6P3W5U3_CLUHA|nr:dual specificity protein kinase CLK1-like [Clupea harengus]
MGYEKKSCHFVCKDWEHHSEGQNEQDLHHFTSGHRGHSRHSNRRLHHEQCHNIDNCRHSNSRSCQRTRSTSVEDDEENHLIYHNGDRLTARYEIVGTLGEGAFGKVVECIDHSFNDSAHVAMKIVKNIDSYRDVAMSEVAILDKMNDLDSDSQYACVRMLDWFNHHGHICIVFELLGLSTYELLQQNNFQPFPVGKIRHMAYQIIKAVRFLHKNKLTHTDLKPENILFVDSDFAVLYYSTNKRDEWTLNVPEVKVVDFGNATFDHEFHAPVVSTRHYRAPEVILELGWNQACDVWSLGCILMEYYLGVTLFLTHSNREHLAMMERVLGPIPTHLLQKTRRRDYVHRNRLAWDVRRSSGRYVRKHCKPLKEYMSSRGPEHQQLFDLVQRMLEYDVTERITLNEALSHPFFKNLRKGLK